MDQTQPVNGSQSDHDSITELKVLVRTLITKVDDMAQQMKEAQIANTAATATLDARWTATHNGMEGRIRSLEDIAARSLPEHNEMKTQISVLQTDVSTLKDGKNQLFGGWKMLLFIGGILAGAIGLVISLVNVMSPHIVTLAK